MIIILQKGDYIMKKIISLSLLIIISLAIFTGCKDTKTYNVLLKDNNSPYSNFEDNKAEGLEVDLLDAISKEENFTINYVKDSEKDDYISFKKYWCFHAPHTPPHLGGFTWVAM